MEKIRIITVPLNDQGMNDMENELEGSHYVEEFKLNEQQFYTLYETDVFNVLNRECDALIDDFESEFIDSDSLLNAKEEINNLFKNSSCYELKVLLKLITLAIEKKTGIYFHF
jgi:hypothetical protein